MLATIIIWVYLAFIFLLYGFGGTILFRRLLSLQRTTSLPYSVTILLGLVISAWIASILSLVMKIGLPAHLLVLMGALLILVFQYAEIKTWLLSASIHTHWIVWILVGLAFLTTLLYAVKTSSNPDTVLYHAQAIHWIEAYPAVPGLGNLEVRLGANSNWFILNALFSFSFLNLQSFHLIPSFLFFVCVLYFLSGFQKLLHGDLHLSQIVKSLCIPIAFYVLIDEVSSPGTDLPVILFYWLILCFWLESIEQESRLVQAMVFLLAIFTITFKLSGVMILLIAAWLLFQLIRQKEFRRVTSYGILAALILLPWMVRTFILTGYWLYPEPALQVFSPHVDWMVPTDRVLQFKHSVQAWSLSPRTTWDEVANLSLIQKLRFWFFNLSFTQRGITILALISPIVFWVFSLLSKRDHQKASYTPVLVLSFLSFLLWLLMAPNYRFGYGFVLGLIMFALSPLIQLVLQRSTNYRFYLLMAVALALSVQQVRVILGSTRDDTQYVSYIVLPADYPRVPTDSCSLGDTTISCARRFRQCSYDAFPCVPQIPKNVDLRGPSFRDGFHKISK